MAGNIMDEQMRLRIFRSFRASYYQDDVLGSLEAHPAEYFDELAANGFNAVWIRGILRNLADAAPFEGLGQEVARHQDILGKLVERAATRGIRVLLYLNEPLCLPEGDPFWSRHPEAMGSVGSSEMDGWPRARAFCTSNPGVKTWLHNAARELFSAVPELGGWFLISASEHLTHCYSHATWGDGVTCQRCGKRKGCEVVAEVISALRDGTRSAGSSADCIAWNWSWTIIEPDPQREILARIPRDVIILADWERGGWMTMPGGRQKWIDEYSLGYIGPSERFVGIYDAARERGLKVMAKLQIGTTHELATVTNLPLIDSLYEKLARAEAMGLEGVLATWNFGNSFNWNTAAFARFLAQKSDRPGPRSFVRKSASERFPGCDPDKVAEGVERLSVAMAWYPFSIPFVYFGPTNYALAYPLSFEPISGAPAGRSWMDDRRGDDFSSCAGAFSVEESVELLGRLADEWLAGVEAMEAGLAGCAGSDARLEAGVARLAGLCFRSARNVLRTYLLRRDRPPDFRDRILETARDEIEVLKQAIPLVEADTRQGFHAECQKHLFTAADLRKKLADLRRLVQSGGG